jgi:hypothetical protein
MDGVETEVDANRRQFDRMLSSEVLALTELVRARNVSYAGADPYRCWRKRGLLGLLVRMEDKLNRVETFLEGEGATEEAWREVLRDIAGYAVCGLVWVGSGIDPSVKVRSDE